MSRKLSLFLAGSLLLAGDLSPTRNAAAQDLAETIAKAAGVPQIDAFLPSKHDVPKTKALAIDGVWSISTIKKRIRIEGGRAYAVQPWLHMLVLKVQPDMVVIRNIRASGAGSFAGEDLPLVGPATFRLTPDGNLDVTVQSSYLGLISYVLLRGEADDPAALQREIDAASGAPRDDAGGDPDLPTPDDEESEPDDAGADDADGSVPDEEYEDGYEDESESEDPVEGDAEAEVETPRSPRKVAAIAHGPSHLGCSGKNLYLSRTSCYSCPEGYKRDSLTRPMDHPQACKRRGIGQKGTTGATLVRKLAAGCPTGQFSHKGTCKSCPEGTRRQHFAGVDTGYCTVLD